MVYLAITLVVIFACGVLVLPLARLLPSSRARNGPLGALAGLALGMAAAFCLAFFARLDAYLVVLGTYIGHTLWLPVVSSIFCCIAGIVFTPGPRR